MVAGRASGQVRRPAADITTMGPRAPRVRWRPTGRRDPKGTAVTVAAGMPGSAIDPATGPWWRWRPTGPVEEVRATTTLLALGAGIAFVYVLLTPHGPNRLALRAAVGSATIAILLVNLLASTGFAKRTRQGVGGLLTMAAAIVWVASWVALDGGVTSPLNATFILPLGAAVVGTPSAAPVAGGLVVAGHLAGSLLGGPPSLAVSLLWVSQFALVSGAFSGVSGTRLAQGRQLRALTTELERLATRDPLTRCLNRRGLSQAVASLDRAGGRSIAVLVADLDHFKDINDRFGHARGDEVLVAVAEAIRRAVREEDVVARTGGEEFTIVLADADAARARSVAERVRRAIAAAHATTRVTTSIGVALSTSEDVTLDRLHVAADRAMYVAKQTGRDRVVIGPAAGAGPHPDTHRDHGADVDERAITGTS
jgi:diguanylate cyclase (GGDEF)-like protein